LPGDESLGKSDQPKWGMRLLGSEAGYHARVASTRTNVLTHYLRYRRWYEALSLVLYAFITGLVNVAANISELQHLHLAYLHWEPYVWEYSSAVVVLIAIPVIGLFDRRRPITWATWRINIIRHFLATIAFSAFKVSGTIVLRKIAYAADGGHYDSSIVPSGIGYDYLPDARLYLVILAGMYVYRFILSQVNGEARTFAQPEVGPPLESLERPQRFMVRKLGKEFLIAAAEIEWLEAQGNYINLHVRGRAYPLRSTMSAVQALLDPEKFVRVHRSHIVNLDYLVEIEPFDTGDARLKLRDGTLVSCSRTYRDDLRARFS
jgi:LytTr DNA-binding domain